MANRVELPAYTDRWMMGDRYGTVVKVVSKRAAALGEAGRMIAHVKLDKSGRTVSVYYDDCRDIN